MMFFIFSMGNPLLGESMGNMFNFLMVPSANPCFLEENSGTHVVKTMPFAPSPSHQHFYRWYVETIPKWVVYGIVLTTLSENIFRDSGIYEIIFIDFMEFIWI